MRILVTGGAGFIGSNIVDAYIEAGHEVAIVDNLTTGKKENLNPKARFYNVDIRETEKLVGTVGNFSPDIINHHAAQIDVRKSVTDPVYNAEVNEQKGAAENHPQEPISPYAITKRTVEMYLHAYAINQGLKYTVLRYGNVYGPRQDPLGEAGAIAIFCGLMLAGKTPT